MLLEWCTSAWPEGSQELECNMMCFLSYLFHVLLGWQCDWHAGVARGLHFQPVIILAIEFMSMLTDIPPFKDLNLVFILLKFLLWFLPEMKHDTADIFMVFLFCFQSWNHSIVPLRCSHINRAIELWQNRVIQQYFFVKIVFFKKSWCSSGSLAAFHNHFCYQIISAQVSMKIYGGQQLNLKVKLCALRCSYPPGWLRWGGVSHIS